MSEDIIRGVNERIKQIESIGKLIRESSKKPTGNKPKAYGSYQHFQSECMKKVDETLPDSLSRIEVITGKEGIHSTERLAECSILWGKHRNLPDPINGLMNELKESQKTDKGEES